MPTVPSELLRSIFPQDTCMRDARLWFTYQCTSYVHRNEYIPRSTDIERKRARPVEAKFRSHFLITVHLLSAARWTPVGDGSRSEASTGIVPGTAVTPAELHDPECVVWDGSETLEVNYLGRKDALTGTTRHVRAVAARNRRGRVCSDTPDHTECDQEYDCTQYEPGLIDVGHRSHARFAPTIIKRARGRIHMTGSRRVGDRDRSQAAPHRVPARLGSRPFPHSCRSRRQPNPQS